MIRKLTSLPSQDPGFQPGRRPVAARQPKFQGGFMDMLDPAIRFITNNVYNRGEGFRYAFEQTVGYTIPRTVQQLNRTRHITGKENTMAAKEMLIRDLAADFADTFLPGLLATLGIGFVLDKVAGTFVRLNLGGTAIDFYHRLAHPTEKTWSSQASFYETLESRLKASALKEHSQTISNSLGLQQLVEEVPSKWWGRQKAFIGAAQTLAERLHLPHMDVKLSAGDQALETSLSELVRDLFHFQKASKLKGLAGEVWGKEMAQLLTKTACWSKFQMAANVVALVASISIPFAIRLMTRHHYGEDAFPGTKAIKEHFSSADSRKVQHQHPIKPEDRKFVLFPYLKQSLKAGNWIPTAVTAAFFAVLLGVVKRRFNLNNALMSNWKDWFRVYEFKKGFPWTTDVQMELTYGLLCGIRLASSRDESEFRETAIRDCALGWPTLTYFFPWFRGFLSEKFNTRLAKSYGDKSLLMKSKTEVRSSDEIKPFFFKNLGLQNPTAAMADAQKYQSRISFLAGLTSWSLLAFLEPMFGIWLTNYMEMKKLKQEGKVKDKASEAAVTAPLPVAQASPVSKANPFMVPTVIAAAPSLISALPQSIAHGFPNGSATMTLPESLAPSLRAFAFAPGQ